MTIDELRGQFPITAERAYLITGAIAPAARSVMAATHSWIERWTHRPLDNFEGWDGEVDRLKGAIGRLIGAEASSIAITDGTSRAANLAIDILALRKGSRVLVDPTTYPSSLYPWLTKTGNMIVTADQELSMEAWPAAAETDLAATCVSHVAWRTGFRHDLAAVARLSHECGGVLLVDVAQSAGWVDIDVGRDGIDVLVGTTIKWLLGPPGIGFLYVRPDLLHGHVPRDIGYVNLRSDLEAWPPTLTLDIEPGGRGLELGVPNLLGMPGAAAGIELVQRSGVTEIAAHAEGLATACIDGLVELGISVRTPPEPGRRAGIVAFEASDALGLASHLRKRRVDVMGFSSGFVRLDVAGFNTIGEVGAALDEIERWLARRTDD